MFFRFFRIISLVFLLVGITTELSSQNLNPFEMRDRLEEKELAGERVPLKSNNPLDIKYTRPSGLNIIQQSEERAMKERFLLKKQKKANVAFWIAFGLLFVFALGLSVYRSFFRMAMRSTLNFNLLENIFRDRRLFNFPLQLFYLLFIANLAFVLCVFLSEYSGRAFDLKLYIISLAWVGLFYLAKHLILLLSDFLIPIKKKIHLYNFSIVIYGIVLGMFLLPLNIIYTVDYQNLNKYMITVMIGVVVLVLLLRAFRSVLLFGKTMRMHFFQFFMYLCAVEIGPILLIRNYFLGS